MKYETYIYEYLPNIPVQVSKIHSCNIYSDTPTRAVQTENSV